MHRVTGIGGLFFRAKNPETMAQWYRKHLGIDTCSVGGNQNDAAWTRLSLDASSKTGLRLTMAVRAKEWVHVFPLQSTCRVGFLRGRFRNECLRERPRACVFRV